ncbi:MAG: hypothetical protein KKF44_05070 [Nanoarchaeota archaeon]|nr:hypothetical protein [Nanoarchaeota archaeon]
MGNLDEFIKRVEAEKPDPFVYDEQKLDTMGGFVHILDSENNHIGFWLGELQPVIELYKNPNKSRHDPLFQNLKFNSSPGIFNPDSVIGNLVLQGMVDIEPDETTKASIRQKLDNLYSSVDNLASHIAENGVALICRNINELLRYDTPKLMMRNLVRYNQELGDLIQNKLPDRFDDMSKPEAYDTVQQLYSELKDFCRGDTGEANYTINLSDKAKNARYILKTDVVSTAEFGIPSERSWVIIAHDDKDLNALTKMGIENQNILYRGRTTEPFGDYEKSLRQNGNKVFPNANIQTAGQYKYMIAAM